MYINIFSNKSKTLSVESRYNYSYIAISPNGNLLIAGNESISSMDMGQLISWFMLPMIS